jgi:cystathionine beta-lyase family protein involved in aluminum resistance
VIGLRGTPGHGSLAEFGATYRALPLTPAGKLDFEALASAVTSTTKCALIQRSCGYSWRETLTMAEIERAIALIKEQNPGCAVVVDNCYGEFVETREPTAGEGRSIPGWRLTQDGYFVTPDVDCAGCKLLDARFLWRASGPT